MSAKKTKGMKREHLRQGHASFDKIIICIINVTTISREHSLTFVKGYKRS